MNNKILVKGLVFTTALLNVPIDSIANTIEEYRIENIDENIEDNKIGSGIKKFFAKIVEPMEELVAEPKEVIKVNKNIVRGSVYELTLKKGQFVPNLNGNPNGYETIKVRTIGNKYLEKTDYDNLRLSGIPKIDLSNTDSDSIPAGAFTNATHLTEFQFPRRIKSIGGSSPSDGAFYNCSGLRGALTIPSSVTSIGKYAFYGCSGFDGALTIPTSVTSIGEYAFYGCSGLSGTLTIPTSITSIADYTFYGCSGFDGALRIPTSITSIGKYAFYGCSGFDGALTIPTSVKNIADYTFYGCSGLTGNLIIPNSITAIGEFAFSGCSGFNGTLTIPTSVTSIGTYAFYGCSGFTGNLIIPNSITSINSAVFWGCSGFTGKLVIPSSVTEMGSSAFRECTGFTGNLVISDNITSVGEYAFDGCTNVKILIKTGESYAGNDYRKDIIKNLPINYTYIEISYNFDTAGTWLETTDYIKVKPTLSAYGGAFENNEGMGVVLDVVEPSAIKVITILKDGLNYTLEKNEDGKYLFIQRGSYNVYIETELGTVSNISFKNNSPILEPSINCSTNTVEIINNGVYKKEEISENFDKSNDLKFNFSNSNWTVENGKLKSQTIGVGSTENEFKVNVGSGYRIQMRVNTSSESNLDWGYIYVNGTPIYKKSGTTNNFEIVECDLQEGENTIKFVYEKNILFSSGDDAMFIDSIKVLNEFTKIDAEVLEYRINGGVWQTYADAFKLNYPIGTKVQVGARAKHDGFISNVVSQEITIEPTSNDILSKVEQAEQSKNPIDIADARDLVNSLPESLEKDQLQGRLDSIFPNIIVNKKTASANLNVSIKLENMLSLSLDTNLVAFENYSGVQDSEMLGVINLTVGSSLPYNLNAYMPTGISNFNGVKKMDIDVLNIRESNEGIYKQFESSTDKLVLREDCVKGNGVKHSIDLKLDSNNTHKADIYKTVIKFEAEQK